MGIDARGIYQFVQDAAGDVAHETVQEWEANGSTYDDETTKLLDDMKANGIRDISGAYADHIYNDKRFLSDMLGDKIYEAGNNEEQRKAVIDDLAGIANFPAWNEVIAEFRNQSW